MVSSFDIEVISDPLEMLPNQGFHFDDPHLLGSSDYDTRFIKPAILFADQVHLVSSRKTVLDFVNMHGWRITNMPMRQMQTYLHLSINRNSEDLDRLGLSPIVLAPPAEAAEILEAMSNWATEDDKGEVFEKRILPYWDSHIDQIVEVIDSFRALWKARHDSLLAPELDAAVERGVLTVQGWVEDLHPRERMFEADEDFLSQSLDGMVNRLQDPKRVALLDSSVKGSDAIDRQSGRRVTDRSAIIANSMISKLVGLDDLPIVEVLDLRDDLRDYLPHFRSEMVRLSEEIAEIGDAADAEEELEARWHREIAPAMEEVRREIAAARYPRRLLDAVTSDPAAMAASAGALAIATSGLAVGLSALLPAIAAAAYPFLKAKTLQDQKVEQAQANRLFFLYALRARLDSR